MFDRVREKQVKQHWWKEEKYITRVCLEMPMHAEQTQAEHKRVHIYLWDP